MNKLVLVIFIVVSFYSVKGYAVSEPEIINNYGTLSSSEIDPSSLIFTSHNYSNEMKIRHVDKVIYFSFKDGSYRWINLETGQVRDAGRLLDSERYIEEGERLPGRDGSGLRRDVIYPERIENIYQLSDLNKPTWGLEHDNKAVYDDYLLFAESVESEALIENLSKPKDINSTLLQSSIQGLSGAAGSLPSCTHEKALLDYGYDGHATWGDCSGLARAGFVVASFSVLECFIPGWNLLGCPAVAAALLYATANMFSTGDHCTATHERAQTNLDVCMRAHEPETDRDVGGERDASGDRVAGGDRGREFTCDRWVRVDNGWQDEHGSGGWDSYDKCVEWGFY